MHGCPVYQIQAFSKDKAGRGLFYIFPVQLNVFSNIITIDKHEFLMHHADSIFHGLYGRLNIDFLPVYENAALKTSSLLDRGHTKEDIHNGGFSGSIFTDQCHNLTRLDFYAHIFQDFISKEILFNVIHL